MRKAAVSRPWLPSWRRRYIVLEGHTLSWLRNGWTGTEPLGALRLDGPTVVEHSGACLAVTDQHGRRLALREICDGDAAALAALLSPHGELPPARPPPSEALELLALKHAGEAEWGSAWGDAFRAARAARAPLPLLRRAKWAVDFALLLSSPMQSLAEAAARPNFALTMWCLAAGGGGARAAALTLSDLGVPRRLSRHFFPAADPVVLEYGGPARLLLLLLPSLVQLLILGGVFVEEIHAAATDGHLRSRVCPMESGVWQTLTSFLLYLLTLRCTLESSRVWLVIGFITSLRDKGRANEALALAGFLDELCQLVLTGTLCLLFVETQSLSEPLVAPPHNAVPCLASWFSLTSCSFSRLLCLPVPGLFGLGCCSFLHRSCGASAAMLPWLLLPGCCSSPAAPPATVELAFNCVALVFIMEIDNLLVKGTFSQNMASDELKRLTAQVTTTDIFLYSVTPAHVWSSFGVHYPSCSPMTRRFHHFFNHWVRPINFVLIPIIAPLYVLVCKFDSLGFVRWVLPNMHGQQNETVT
ncbi:hypothetical protein AB1Y20_003953 [Prymnesium parvum]|uniref:Uncharacterized protein n=1 Tax=Prymnesium parvum TaxID=97485 RepID=A0AB34J7S0_PRYPA